MNVGVIGTGVMGKNHVRAYLELKDVEKVYVYDVNEDAAKEMKMRHGQSVVVSPTMDSLLHSVEAVSICTPTTCHFEIARTAVEKGVHCLIEKPLGLTPEEGEALLERVNGDLVVGVGHIERFNPIMREIKNLIKKPRYIEIRRHNPASARIDDVDVVSDLMIHDIDLVWNYFVNGSPYELYSFWDPDLCKAIARFEDCSVSLSASRIACKKIRAIYVEDEDFSVEGDFMNQEVYVYRRPQRYAQNGSRYIQENVIEKVLVNKVEPLKDELMTFLDCVKERREFPVTVEQAVKNMRIAQEIKEKGRKRREPVDIQASHGCR